MFCFLNIIGSFKGKASTYTKEKAELLNENSSEFKKGSCLWKPLCFRACVPSWMAT